jgi:hypothetical protein
MPWFLHQFQQCCFHKQTLTNFSLCLVTSTSYSRGPFLSLLVVSVLFEFFQFGHHAGIQDGLGCQLFLCAHGVLSMQCRGYATATGGAFGGRGAARQGSRASLEAQHDFCRLCTAHYGLILLSNCYKLCNEFSFVHARGHVSLNNDERPGSLAHLALQKSMCQSISTSEGRWCSIKG